MKSLYPTASVFPNATRSYRAQAEQVAQGRGGDSVLTVFLENVKWVIIALSLFAGIISAFVDNVATLLIVFRRYGQRVDLEERTVVTDFFPTWLLLGTMVLLILESFVPEKPHVTNGLICMGLMIVGLVRESILRGAFKATFAQAFKEIDWYTLLLLSGLFIVIAGIAEAGVVNEISNLFVWMSGGNLFTIYSLLVWTSVVFSAFTDNIPYVATMLPVTARIARLMGVDPTILYFGLLCSATMGGNLTPIRASANITALDILRKYGYEASTKDFMKISIPLTLTAVISGYILVWFIWM